MKELIQEKLSDVLYHVTDIKSALKILEEDRFKLGGTISHSEGSDLGFGPWDTEIEDYRKGKKLRDTDRPEFYLSGGKMYFGSFARSPQSKFKGFKPESNKLSHIILFKIDGRKMGQRWKGGPINYFPDQGTFGGLGRFDQIWDEMEDRVISDKPFIDRFSGYILEMRILLKDEVLWGKEGELKRAILLAKKKGIGVKMWKRGDWKSWQFGRGGNLKISDLKDKMVEPEWREKINYIEEELTKEEKEFIGLWTEFAIGGDGKELKRKMRDRDWREELNLGNGRFRTVLSRAGEIGGRKGVERWRRKTILHIRDRWKGSIQDWVKDLDGRYKKLTGII